MRILTDCSLLSEKQIETIEERFHARYVFESQLKLRSRWSDFSAAVFYTEIPNHAGSNWFGIWLNEGKKFMVADAISAAEEAFFGAVAENGDVIYSRHPYDYRESDDKTVFIDGGRDHCRHDLMHEIVKLRVFQDRVAVVPRQNNSDYCRVPYREELDFDLATALFSWGQATAFPKHAHS